jgi:hypothetical protein
MTEGVTVMSLPASLLQKISATMDHLCQIMLNQKLLCKLKKLCNFSSNINMKACKMKLRKTRTACIWDLRLLRWWLWRLLSCGICHHVAWYTHNNYSTMKMEAAGCPKTSVLIHQTTKHCILVHTLHMQHAATIQNFQFNDVCYNSTLTASCPETWQQRKWHALEYNYSRHNCNMNTCVSPPKMVSMGYITIHVF